jgi:hypothetical protein
MERDNPERVAPPGEAPSDLWLRNFHNKQQREEERADDLPDLDGLDDTDIYNHTDLVVSVGSLEGGSKG